MITEPNIDRKLIKATIEKNYGFKIVTLSFIKGGEASWGYKVQSEEGNGYFFKIHTGLTEHEKRFELTYRLYTDCGIKNISYPIKNFKGSLVIYINTYPCALFNFISGSNASQKGLTEKERFALGELLGKIHKAKDIIGNFLIREDFMYGNIDKLLESLEKINNFIKSDSEYIRKTAQLLVENKEKILNRIQNLRDLGDSLRNQNLEFVICHGEPHQWNTMINDKGEVFLIDWDDCLFAPKEKDLNMIREDSIKMDGYKSIVGDFELNKDIILYYNMEWNISEIEAWTSKMFYEKSNDEQMQHDLDLFTTVLKELDTVDYIK